MNDEDTRRHLFCPQCDYDLTGLPESRCPECGAIFSREALEAEAAAPPTLDGAGRSLLDLVGKGFVLGLFILALALLEWPSVLGWGGAFVLACFAFHHAFSMAKRVARASAAQRGQSRSDPSEFLVMFVGLLIADIFLGIIGVGTGVLTLGLVLFLIQSLVLVR